MQNKCLLGLFMGAFALLVGSGQSHGSMTTKGGDSLDEGSSLFDSPARPKTQSKLGKNNDVFETLTKLKENEKSLIHNQNALVEDMESSSYRSSAISLFQSAMVGTLAGVAATADPSLRFLVVLTPVVYASLTKMGHPRITQAQELELSECSLTGLVKPCPKAIPFNLTDDGNKNSTQTEGKIEAQDSDFSEQINLISMSHIKKTMMLRSFRTLVGSIVIGVGAGGATYYYLTQKTSTAS